MTVTPQQFRTLYHRMLEPKPDRFHIATHSDDDWGVVITRKVISGVQVWHSLKKGQITLGLTTSYARSLIPEGEIPPGSTSEVSAESWRMFRWSVPEINGSLSPMDQPEMAIAIQTVKLAFEWFRTTRIDLQPK